MRLVVNHKCENKVMYLRFGSSLAGLRLLSVKVHVREFFEYTKDPKELESYIAMLSRQFSTGYPVDIHITSEQTEHFRKHGY